MQISRPGPIFQADQKLTTEQLTPTETSPEHALIPRQSLPDMAAKYQQAIRDMQAGLLLIHGAQEALVAAFGTGSRTRYCFEIRDPHRHGSFDLTAADIETQWKQQAWTILVDRMELKRICSVARAAEIDRQMADPKNLPDITEANMIAMIEGNATNLAGFLEEAAVEVFESFRPWRERDSNGEFKTNQVFQIGERVCLNGYIDPTWGSGRLRLSYFGDRQQRIRCLDNVMHLLDGKGPIPSHCGPLVDALNSENNKGRVETEYFEAKCFKKGSLHLRFKRLDLLARLNAIGAAGAPQLPGQKAPR